MPGLDPKGIAQKDEIALSLTDLDVAGRLNDKQLAGLKEIVQLKARLLGDTHVEIIDQAKMKWEYGGFTSTISFPVDENDELAPEKYSKLSLVKIPFECQDFRAAIPLSDKSVRNSLEKGNLGSFVMRTAGPRVGLDIQGYGLLSKANHINPDYRKLNGILNQAVVACTANGNLLNPATPHAVDDELFYQMELAHPEQYWDDLDNMRYYCSRTTEAGYAYKLKGNDDSEGYRYREQDSRFRLRFDGVPIFPLALMPRNVMLLTHKDNIVTAIEENVTWEIEREAKKSRYLYHLRYSFDMQFAVPEAVTIHTNVAVPTIPSE